MTHTISPAIARPVQFRKESYPEGHPAHVKAGVYINGEWKGEILRGSAYFPAQISVNGVVSPYLRAKRGVKGAIKPSIRNALVSWALTQNNQN